MWRGFWSVVVVSGVGLAVLEWSAVRVLVALVLLVVLCLFVRYLLTELAPERARWGTGRRALSQSLMVSIGILTVWSFGRISPPLGLLVILSAGLSSPVVVIRMIHSARRSTPAVPIGDAPDPSPSSPRTQDEGSDSRLTQPESMGPLNGLDDLQLCRLWRESFWVLRKPAPPVTVLCLVALREACLNELEHRDAVAMHAWLDSGARASSGPEKYLAPPRRGDSR